MRATLQQIAPYLPYNLKVANKLSNGVITGTYVMKISNHNDEGIENVVYGVNQIPIFIPLSDLNQEGWRTLALEETIFNNDEYFVVKEQNPKAQLSYHFKNWLIKNHFDVFNLIEEGLAISIHDIKTNS